MQNQKKNRGFTLIETILVLGIFSILALLAPVLYTRLIVNNAVIQTTNQLAENLRAAQMYSMMGRQNGAWGVYYGSNTIVFFQGNSYASRNTAIDRTATVNTNVSVTGFSEIVFTRVTGLPNSTPTITISGSGTTKTVTINAQGMVTRS